MVIGGNFNTMAAQVYLQAMGNYNLKEGTALATILLTLSILMFVLQKYWVGNKSYVTLTVNLPGYGNWSRTNRS
jgi:iron(III) transport system permease protein